MIPHIFHFEIMDIDSEHSSNMCRQLSFIDLASAACSSDSEQEIPKFRLQNSRLLESSKSALQDDFDLIQYRNNICPQEENQIISCCRLFQNLESETPLSSPAKEAALLPSPVTGERLPQPLSSNSNSKLRISSGRRLHKARHVRHRQVIGSKEQYLAMMGKSPRKVNRNRDFHSVLSAAISASEFSKLSLRDVPSVNFS